MTNIANQPAINPLEIFNADQNKGFFIATMKSALKRLLVSLLSDSSRIGDFFEDSIVRVATLPKSLEIVASAVAINFAAIALIAWYATETVWQKVLKSVRSLIRTPLSSSLSGSDWFSEEVQKSRWNRRSKKKASRCKFSVFSLDKGSWSWKRSMKKASKLFESSTTSNDVTDNLPVLKVL